MSAEIIDYLLVFWAILAIVVYTVGNIYDGQLQEKKKRLQKERRRYSETGGASTNLDDLSWAESRRRNSKLDQAWTPTWARPDISSFQQPSQHQQLYSQVGESNNFVDRHQQQFAAESGFQQQVNTNYQYNATNHQAESRSLAAEASSATIPTATGFNSDCVEWVNGILYLFYTQPEKYGPIICENVYRSLNEKLSNLASSSVEHSSLLIEFTGVNRQDSNRPELTNIRTESESDKSISASCKIYLKRLSLSLSIRASSRARFDLDHDEQLKSYELVLENLEGKLKSMAMLNEKLIVIQFIEKPDTKILLRPLPVASSVQFAQTVNEDSLVQLIMQAITQVVVDLYFGDDVDFPQYKHHSSAYSNYKHKLNNMIKGSASELKRQIKQDFFGALSPSPDHKERKVFVKIIRATNINYNQNVTCLMELDTPKQQAVSSTKPGSSDPYWDEHFLFTVNEKSNELTIELWDSINSSVLTASDQRPFETAGLSASLKRNQHLSKSSAGNSRTSSKWQKADLVAGGKFLGLTRVNIEDLHKNPVQKVSATLRPIGPTTDLSNSVGGELQLELLFMEHSVQPPTATGHSTLGPLSPSDQPNTGAPLQKSNSLSSLSYQQGDVVSIDRKLTPSGFVITTTTITKQPNVARQQQRQQQHQQQHLHHQQQQLLMARSQSPAGSTSMATEHSFDEMNFDGVSSSQMSAAAAATANQHSDRRSEGTGAGSSTGGRPLSRSRSRSRSFLRAIRKRLSFSRTRSRSVGESTAHELGGNRSPTSMASYEARSRASSEVSVSGIGDGGRAKSVPASRDPSEVPTIVINKGRLSDTASAFTFTHPKSQLVYEVAEPSLHDGKADGPRSSAVHYKYYAVSDDPASQRKWRKRGLKLHVFNEHQFVACHLAGSSTCHLCGRVFSRRPGKQGYKCRNCHLLSHKQCHIKVDHNCPYAKRDGLKLEYIDADPPANLVGELMLNQVGDPNTSQAPALIEPAYHYQQPQQRTSQRTRARPMRKGVKSISVEVDDR